MMYFLWLHLWSLVTKYEKEKYSSRISDDFTGTTGCSVKQYDKNYIISRLMKSYCNFLLLKIN